MDSTSDSSADSYQSETDGPEYSPISDQSEIETSITETSATETSVSNDDEEIDDHLELGACYSYKLVGDNNKR